MEFAEKKIHFIGIGGIGMSALAQMMAHESVAVSGSDRSESPVTELLESKGIMVAIGHTEENLPEGADLVVHSDAVHDDNPERREADRRGVRDISYFQALGEISKGKRTIAVAGTHGKTTTTGMLACILHDAGAEPTAIIGSIVKDFGSNYLSGTSDLFVVEACEYRDHLLELTPHVLVITNLEWDHTDYFPSLAALQETFRKAIAKVPADGAIITNPHNPNIAPLLSSAKAPIVDYTVSGRSDLPEGAYELRAPGEFNQMNARAAAAAARFVLQSVQHQVLHKVDESIRESLPDFHGTWRRFEYKGKTKNGADVYDDYAHHPTAIKVTLEALRGKVKGKVFVAFHPHLYSRTRDLLDEFATAFVGADKVFFAPIYAARETDDGSISSEILAERVRATGVEAKALDSFDAIEKALGEAQEGDTIITMGAGDIYKVADALVAK